MKLYCSAYVVAQFNWRKDFAKPLQGKSAPDDLTKASAATNQYEPDVVTMYVRMRSERKRCDTRWEAKGGNMIEHCKQTNKLSDL